MEECYEQIGRQPKAEHCYLKAIILSESNIESSLGGVLDSWAQEKKERLKH